MYKELVNAFQIQKGDRIWLSSDIMKLAYVQKMKGEKFDSAALLECFKAAVGMEGTLMLPVFSFDFSNKGYYDYRKTMGTTGVLGNAALKDAGFVRTRHPMHSFAVWGRDAEILYSMENKHAFGEDSPFGYCHKNNVTQIMLGTDYVRAMTFVHYVETMCHVPYRFAKEFKGIYVDGRGVSQERTYQYAARRLDVGTTEQFNRIGEILEEKGIAQEICLEGGIRNYKVRLGDSYAVIRDDIVHNQCRNIYDFSVSRAELFEGYGEGV